MSKFKIGDVVRVVDDGEQYPYFSRGQNLTHYLDGARVTTGTLGVVVYLGSSGGFHDTVAGVRCTLIDGSYIDYVICEDGLEYILPSKFNFVIPSRKTRTYYARFFEGKFLVDWDANEGDEVSYCVESMVRSMKCWKIVEPVECNGVDAKNNPLHFTMEDLKPLMRCVAKSGTYTVVPNIDKTYDEDLILASTDDGWLSGLDSGHEDYVVTAVYDVPPYNCDALVAGRKGPLLWKRVTKEQQEKDKRNAQVKLEIKALEEKIEVLNNSLEG